MDFGGKNNDEEPPPHFIGLLSICGTGMRIGTLVTWGGLIMNKNLIAAFKAKILFSFDPLWPQNSVQMQRSIDLYFCQHLLLLQKRVVDWYNHQSASRALHAQNYLQ